MVNSPLPKKTKMITTPMTSAMEMYNWLTGTLKSYSKVHQFLNQKSLENLFSCPNIEEILVFTNTLLDCEKEKDEKILENRRELIIGFFCKTFSIFSKSKQCKDERMKNDKTFINSLLLVCTECVFYILNCNIPFERLILAANIEIFHIWNAVKTFVGLDKSMPDQIKDYFCDLEILILKKLCWQGSNGNSTGKMIKEKYPEIDLESLREENEDEDFIEKESEEYFIQRIFFQCAFEIQIISEALNLKEKESEMIWLTMKFVFCKQNELLRNRNLEQIILCAVYGVCKVRQIPMKFQTIISAYKGIACGGKGFKDSVYNCRISENEQGDIIKLYNAVFIQSVKSFLLSLPTKKIQGMRQGGIWKSPLKEIISPSRNIPMTPKTPILYAYLESPFSQKDLCTENIENNEIPEKSFKKLNFEDWGEVKHLESGANFITKKLNAFNNLTNFDNSSLILAGKKVKAEKI